MLHLPPRKLDQATGAAELVTVDGAKAAKVPVAKVPVAKVPEAKGLADRDPADRVRVVKVRGRTVIGRTAMLEGLRPEQEMLCHCARTRIEADCAQRIGELVDQGLDWPHLLMLAGRHQVTPLLYRTVKEICPRAVPALLMRRLHDHYFDNVGRGLFVASQLRNLLQRMETDGIEVIPYKGVVIAKHLYGDVGLREFGDIDLLVRERDRSRAVRALDSAGYRAQGFHGDTECHFVSGDDRVNVDLHWRFFRCVGFYFNPEAWWTRRVHKSLFARDVNCFPDEELMLILCANATKECWNQSLHSLCDIAEMIRSRPHLNWDRVMREAEQLDLTRMLLAGISLAQQLLGARPPDLICEQIQTDANVSSLSKTLRWRLFPQSAPKPDRWIIYRWDLAKMTRRRDRAIYILRLLSSYLKPSDKDRDFIQLPSAFEPLYYAIRPVRIAVTFTRGKLA